MAGVEAADKERQQVQATFSVFDADNSGAIDVGELEGLLKELCIPVKDKDELHAIMTELDGDGSGDIDFHEFYMWFKQVGESKKGGIIGNALSASLAVQKFGNAMAGATRMLEAKRVIIACAEHDAAQHARLLFRQSRPDEGHDGDAVAREVAVDLAAEKRFSAVRAVVGRPTQDGGGGGDNEVPEYEARSLRARRLLYHPDLLLHVLAYHRSKQNDALSPPKPKRGEPLEICLNGHRLKDDGAWALADAIRSGGGGGALRVLALQANGLSGDGVGSLCTALASGAALKLESLDLSKKKRCSPAMQKRRAPAIMAAVASVAAVVAYCVMPPRAFPDRLAFIPEEMTIIDNKFYDLPQWAAQWHTPDAALNTLGHMNSARVPYFDDAWRRELGGTNGSFLDVGCGGGLLTNALAARGYKLRGVDPSTNSLVAARQQAAEELPTAQRPEFLEGTCYALPAADGALDGVVMSDVLEHFHDLRAAVGEVYRVLRPGGVFVFDTINRSYFSWFVLIVLLEKIAGGIPAGTHDWRLFITPDEVEQLLNSTGFEVGPRTDLVGMRPEDPSDTSKGFVQDPSDVSATYLWWARKPL